MKEIHLKKIDSTNTYAKEHREDFISEEITCISADEQTAGRGRFQRKWTSPANVNIYATFCFKLSASSPHLISLSQVMATSFATVLMSEGLKPKIKWPNDVQLNGKKVSGILCEIEFKNDFAEIFLGIGINVNMGEVDLANIGQPATSLQIETQKIWDRIDLLKKVQNQFEEDLKKFKKEGFSPFHPLLESLLAYKGEKIRCFDGKKYWEGICHSLTADGQLNLYLSNHTIKTIVSGDVEV